jgi:hypothetical protein
MCCPEAPPKAQAGQSRRRTCTSHQCRSHRAPAGPRAGGPGGTRFQDHAPSASTEPGSHRPGSGFRTPRQSRRDGQTSSIRRSGGDASFPRVYSITRSSPGRCDTSLQKPLALCGARMVLRPGGLADSTALSGTSLDASGSAALRAIDLAEYRILVEADSACSSGTGMSTVTGR